MASQHLLAHEASEISYDEQRYPARPRRLRPKVRLRDLFTVGPRAERTGKPRGDNSAYVGWLVEQSMLEDAKRFATQFSGQGSMWQNPLPTRIPGQRSRRRQCGSPRTRSP